MSSCHMLRNLSQTVNQWSNSFDILGLVLTNDPETQHMAYENGFSNCNFLQYFIFRYPTQVLQQKQFKIKGQLFHQQHQS